MGNSKGQILNDAYEDMLVSLKKVREASIDYLKEVLNKMNLRQIEIDEENTVTVNYNGGGHPEYNSNCFSVVSMVYLNDKDEIYLSIEETDEYSVDELNAIDLAEVAISVQNTYINRFASEV